MARGKPWPWRDARGLKPASPTYDLPHTAGAPLGVLLFGNMNEEHRA